MLVRSFNAFILAALPFLVAVAGYCLVTGSYLDSFIALLVIVACMEMRVRAGYRGIRGPLFFAHLVCGVMALALVGTLTYHAYAGLAAVACIAFIAMALTGTFLIRGSWTRV